MELPIIKSNELVWFIIHNEKQKQKNPDRKLAHQWCNRWTSGSPSCESGTLWGRSSHLQTGSCGSAAAQTVFCGFESPHGCPAIKQSLSLSTHSNHPRSLDDNTKTATLWVWLKTEHSFPFMSSRWLSPGAGVYSILFPYMTKWEWLL